MTNKKYSIGFIGTGLMGRPMILRLLKADFTVHIWNRSTEKLPPLVNAGAHACASIKILVAASDVILLCLADTAVVETIVLDTGDGVINYGSAAKLLIDLSSIHPERTRYLASKLYEKCGMGWVDAPVSGGVAGAELGNLAIMAGGIEEQVAVAREVLAPLYKQLTHMGDVGSGQMSKLCNQIIVSCNVMVIAEMMALAKQAGIAAEKIPEALAGGFADSKPLQIIAPEMAAENFEPVKWRVKTLLKDLQMAIDMAGQCGSALPLSDLAAQLMQLHAARGYQEQDPATLIKLYQNPKKLGL